MNFRVLQVAFLNGRICNPGDIVSLDVQPGNVPRNVLVPVGEGIFIDEPPPPAPATPAPRPNVPPFIGQHASVQPPTGLDPASALGLPLPPQERPMLKFDQGPLLPPNLPETPAPAPTQPVAPMPPLAPADDTDALLRDLLG